MNSHNNFDKNSTPAESSGPQPEDGEICDQEWELRTGRGIYVIQETLPRFFELGLVTAVDKATGAPKPSSTTHHFHIPLLDIPGTSTLNLTGTHKGEHISVADELDALEGKEEEEIYSTKVSLEYTPPVRLPAPFPKTFKVEGLPLYLASSALVRHTMNALYSDLVVTLTKVSVRNTPPPSGPNDHRSSEGEYMTPSRRKEKKLNREKHLVVRQLITGLTRVGGKQSEWEVESVYTFSPASGLIWKHVVTSIHPAPHLAVYDSLKLSLGKVFGFGHPTPTATAGAVGVHDQARCTREGDVGR